MIRTTETGGIKMIYNGEVVDGKCESTRGTHGGFLSQNANLLTIDNSYLYATSFTYDTNTNEFTLVDPFTGSWNDNDYSTLLGTFTCLDNSGTCATMYGIGGYYSSTQAYASAYTVGSVNQSQIGSTPFNASMKSVSFSGYMYNKSYNISNGTQISGTVKFGNSFIYANGTYTLSGATQDLTNLRYSDISNTHYTCWNASGSCETISYVYSVSYTRGYDVKLTGGKGVNEALNEMLFANNVNNYNSSIKGVTDSWYAQNLISNSSFLEDAVYCVDRSIDSLGGWDPNGGSASTDLSFKSYLLITDLSCPNVTDQYAVSNNKAKLTYPVGLLRIEEANGINPPKTMIKSNSYWWLGSPVSFYSSIGGNAPRVIPNGDYTVDSIAGGESSSSRPVVSLKNGIVFGGGDGSETDPWVVDEREKLHDKIVNLSNVDSKVTKYNGNVTDTVGNTTVATKVYFDKDLYARNIIFGGFCWQVIRTTETGGTKVIYNGEPVDGKCESTRGNHKGVIGTYAASSTLNSSYLYGTSFTYNTTTNEFTLVDTITATWSDSTYQSLLGKFTCINTTGTCTTLYSVNGYLSATSAYTASYTIGDTNYAQIGTSAYNNNYRSPAMEGYMFNKVYGYQSGAPASGSLMGNDVSYSNGTYTLLPAAGESTLGTTKDNTHHYTCNTTSSTCNKVRYYYYGNYYIELDGSANIEAAVNEMLYDNNVNRYNSSLKGVVDSWYAQKLSTHTNMLEDAVYCNARNMIDATTNGWNKDGNLSAYAYFKSYNLSNDISCANETDQFAVGNNKAKLTYPVGLATHEELYTLTNNNDSSYYSLIKTGFYWWGFSPSYFGEYQASARYVLGSGFVNTYSNVYQDMGVRLAVSLKNDVTINSGSGSETDPWIVE